MLKEIDLLWFTILFTQKKKLHSFYELKYLKGNLSLISFFQRLRGIVIETEKKSNKSGAQDHKEVKDIKEP